MEQVRNEQTIYSAAVYCRLSKDDEQAGESVSIETQKMMLTDFCHERGFSIYEIYADDGYSGLNFNRPAFTRLLEDIDSGKINLVITKDLSRLGRDYIQTGYYTDVYFSRKRVRYIAVNDGIDTNRDDNDIAKTGGEWFYDAAGNIVSRYDLVYEEEYSSFIPYEVEYEYESQAWGDLLTSYNGKSITRDDIGNPLTYDGWTYEWEHGRQLASAEKNDVTWTYTYNADGLRTAKTNDTDTWNYVYNGSQLTQLIKGTDTLYFAYDANGTPLTVTYKGVPFYYETNLQGDVVGIRNYFGVSIVTYTYDAWGNLLSTDGSAKNALGKMNPLRYRGYVFDIETGLYYVSSRYYDPEIGRWINADSVVAGVGGSIQGYNMFAYCMNNPVNMSDPTGSWPKWIETAASWVNNNIIQPVKNFFSSSKQSNVVNASSHDANRRPYTGEPGSTYTAPNGDSRTYGPDGTPEHDYDHDDHGRPDKHPHDPNGGHNHDWENGVRGPAYSIGWEPIAGAALVTVCVIGIVVVAADDATGIGVADDFLFGPLGAGVGEGLILIFG